MKKIVYECDVCKKEIPYESEKYMWFYELRPECNKSILVNIAPPFDPIHFCSIECLKNYVLEEKNV